MIKINSYWFAVAQLVVCGIIWGFSFTLVRFALVDFSTAQLLLWRFLGAFIIAESIFFFISRKAFKASHSDIKSAFWSGIFLGLSLMFQIHGLNYTTATNSAFITTTYVVMIPFIAFFFFKHKIRGIDFLLAFTALGGMVLLLNLLGGATKEEFSLNFGDLLTLGSALTAGVQIILIGIFAKTCVSAFRFNTYQIFWSLIAVVPFLLYQESLAPVGIWPTQVSVRALAAVVMLILLVSILAFFLQVNAQKHLPTPTASMLCLLEAPFSFFFANLFLGEKLNLTQGIGAVVIIASAALSVYVESKKPPIILPRAP